MNKVRGPWECAVKVTPSMMLTAESKNAFTPLDLDSLRVNDEWSEKISFVVWLFVILGVSLRLLRYLLNFPLWSDEAFLASSFIHRGYSDLLGPLEYHQISPILFLWTELSCVKLLGFSEYSLRLIPCLAGIASVFLFRLWAKQLLGGIPLVLAVAIFAVAQYLIGLGSEAKPYAVDLMVSLVLLTLATRFLLQPESHWNLWLLAAVIPLAVGLSFPSVFVAGAVSISLILPVWKGGNPVSKYAYITYNLILIGAFALVWLGAHASQYHREYRMMAGFWREAFPPWDQVDKVALWAVRNVRHVFAFRGDKPVAAWLSFLCFVGGVLTIARRRRTLLLLLLAPFALAFLAAALRGYPFGGSIRVTLYLAPIISLVAGVGWAVLLSLIRSPYWRYRAVALSVVFLGALGLGLALDFQSRPYKNMADQQNRFFAQSFWAEKAKNAELVCAQTDLGKGFLKRAFYSISSAPYLRNQTSSAQYLCNQKIYSPRHRRNAPPDWRAVSPEHPLRCVVFSLPRSRDQASLPAWLKEMQARYELVRQDIYLVNAGEPEYEHCYEVYEFVPIPQTRAGLGSAAR